MLMTDRERTTVSVDVPGALDEPDTVGHPPPPDDRLTITLHVPPPLATCARDRHTDPDAVEEWVLDFVNLELRFPDE